MVAADRVDERRVPGDARQRRERAGTIVRAQAAREERIVGEGHAGILNPRREGRRARLALRDAAE